MESEFISHAEQVSVLDKSAEVADVCEEVLLPASVANGASVTDVDYFEQSDPIVQETDPMADVGDVQEEVNTKLGKMKHKQHGQGVEISDVVEEPDEEVEEEDYEELEDDEPGVEEAHEDEEEEEVEPVVERIPTQVPKKRKDAAMLAAAAEVAAHAAENAKQKANVKIKSDKVPVLKEEEKPTSSIRNNDKDNTVEEEQCRVCTATEDLVSIFKKVEQSTVADMLMSICPTVSIARKDFMPQFICNPCLDNVTIAVQLKTQCETTERELRKKLSRSKNKLRRPTGYVVIDAPVESDPPSEEEPNDDEFKVSDEASISLDDDTEDSDFSNNRKKRVVRGTGARRGRRKSAVVTPTQKTKEKKRIGRPPMKRQSMRSGGGSSSDENSELRSTHKRKRVPVNDKDTNEKAIEYPCDECEQVFTRKLSLVLHKKAHIGGRELINCEICGKQFKIQGAYRTHLEKHKEDDNGFSCSKCDKIFTSKVDMRHHLQEFHEEPGALHQCERCKRIFVSQTRLDRHKENRCPGYEIKTKKQEFEGFAVGKDLFKSVAPLTTTYWSDSFSD